MLRLFACADGPDAAHVVTVLTCNVHFHSVARIGDPLRQICPPGSVEGFEVCVFARPEGVRPFPPTSTLWAEVLIEVLSAIISEVLDTFEVADGGKVAHVSVTLDMQSLDDCEGSTKLVVLHRVEQRD